jgi:glutamate formiminotransferase
LGEGEADAHAPIFPGLCERTSVLECVINVSEGRDPAVIEAVAGAARACLLDVHTDAHHHRTVLTLAGPGLEEAVQAVTVEAVRRIDLRTHVGVHPRLGAVDVVPFAPLAEAGLDDALGARDRFAAWADEHLQLPCFLYGPERALPHVRREAFRSLLPDLGPPRPHPTAGAVCVGARPVLVAYNLWLAPGTPLQVASRVASEVRQPSVRALGLDLGVAVQVSLNLIDSARFGPADAYDAVAARAPVARAELVGLVPRAVLDAIPPERWPSLDLSPQKTIEARLSRAAVRPTPLPDGEPGPAGGGAGAAPAR